MDQLNLQYKLSSQYLSSGLDKSDDNSGDNQRNITMVCLFCSKHFNYHNNFNDNQLNTICRYLKIELEQVVKNKDNTGQIALCEECTSVTSKLSSLFSELEVTQMWINSLLRTLMRILIMREGTNHSNNGSQEEIKEGEILRELIMEKCNSTIKTMNFPQLKLRRCQLPVPAVKQEVQEDDGDEVEVDISPILLDRSIKLEETTNVTYINEDDSTPPPSPMQTDEEPVSETDEDEIPKDHFVKNAKKRKPFWFIKSSHELTPQGKKLTKFNCPFCPKVLSGYSGCKIHIIGKHPEHIFPSQQLPNLTLKEFSSCCSTLLEDTVAPISNLDGKGKFTTFECKFCPVGLKTRSSDKRVVQVHMIRSHYNKLVRKLKEFQELHGSVEFEEKRVKYSTKRTYSRAKRNSTQNEVSSTAPKESPCETCGKVFSCGYSLWRHKRLSCLKKGALVTQVNEEDGEESRIIYEDEEGGEQEYIGHIDNMEDHTAGEEIISHETEMDPLSLD